MDNETTYREAMPTDKALLAGLDLDLFHFATLLQDAREHFESLPMEEKKQIWKEAQDYSRKLITREKEDEVNTTCIGGAAALCFMAALGLQHAAGELPIGLNIFMAVEPSSAMATAGNA